MLKNRVRFIIILLGVMAVSMFITACGTSSTSTTVAESQTDIDAIVEKKIQEQLEIDRRVKEGIDAAKATEETIVTMAATEASKNSGTYLLPFSNERLVTDADLATLSKDQLRLARNEIFARHGRMYETKDLNDYFSSQGWYTPSISADQWNDKVFSKVESDNVTRIANYEKNGSVDAPASMILFEGAYTCNFDTGTQTYYVYTQDAGDIDIYFEWQSRIQHYFADVSGYMSDEGNGKYKAVSVDYSGGNPVEYPQATLQMVSNGMKDIDTGDLYVYSPFKD